MIEVIGWNWRGRHRGTLAPLGASGQAHFAWSYTAPFGPLTHPLAADLVQIVRAAHLADRWVRRSQRLGQRIRRIEVQVSVLQPGRWKKVAGRLEDLAGFASADDWRFRFRKESTPAPVRRHHPRWRQDPPAGVALFSGGLDSLCGAALRAEAKEPWVYLTHSPPGRERTVDLLRRVWCAFGGKPNEVQCVSCRLEVRERGRDGRRSMFQEPTRRSRPFYFLGLACAVALDLGVNRVQMSENGALALNLPYRRDLYGGSIARQAPAFLLRGFADLLEELEPDRGPWHVENPLAVQTKGEACRKLGPASNLSAETVSCEYVGRQAATVRAWRAKHPRLGRRLGEGPQCGLCLPCLVRRAALQHADILDPDSGYFFDARREGDWDRGARSASGNVRPRPPLYDHAATHAFFLRRFCRRLLAMDLAEFAVTYLPELRLQADRGLKESPHPTGFHSLMRKFAQEMLAFLDRNNG